jgi:hypothetical protein
MTINVQGADGSNFAFPDGTAEADITGAMDAHYGAPAAPAVPSAEPISATNLARSAARGVPIAGGLVDKAEAATEAALAPAVEPFLTPGPNSLMPSGGFGARYAKALALQQAKDTGFDTAHPVTSTAAKIAGGVGSFGGAIKAVPELASTLGFEGTIPQMITKGAVSGAGLSAADALTRGEDPGTAAVEGGALGAVGGPTGRLIGKAVGAGMRAVRGAPALEHAVTTPVAGVDVPVPTADPAVASQIEIARRGGAGVPAQQVVQTGDQGVQSALDQAKGNIGASLDPNASPAAIPQDSAASVAAELQANEANRFQTEQGVMQRALQATQEASQGTQDIRQSLDTTVAPPEVIQAAHDDFAKFGPKNAFVPQKAQAISDKFGPRAAEGYTSEYDRLIAANQQAVPVTTGAGIGAEPKLPATPAGLDTDVLTPAATQAAQEAPPISPPASGVAPPNPATIPAIHAESPLAAGEVLSAGIQRKAEEAAATRTAAYAAKAAIPGEYNAAALKGSGNAIRNALSSGPDAVRVSEGLTPRASQALQIIDETIGGKPPAVLPNEATPFTAVRGEGGKFESGQAPQPITGETMEDVRKQLNMLYGDSMRAANGPGGNATDLRAMRRIIDAFDTHIGNVEDAGGFSGDADALAKARDAARASHVAYKTTFQPRNPGDKTGASIEKIVGKFDGQEAGPDQIMQMAYGSPAEPGGTPAAQLAQRIKSMFGENSKEWAAYKQGLLSHLVDNPDGTPRDALDAAARIDKFLKAPKGKILSQTAFTADDRAALANHVERLNSSQADLQAAQPVALKDLGAVDKVIARITGRDGGPPASLNDVTNFLFGPTAGKSSVQQATVLHLKRVLSPEGFSALQNGMWKHLTDVPPGKLSVTAQHIWSNLDQFFNGSGSAVSKALYPENVRVEGQRLAEAFKAQIPLPGTTNPSGSATIGSQILRKSAKSILPIIGYMHGDLSGAVAGALANKVVEPIAARRAARQIGSLYYGPQPKVPIDPRFAKAAGILTRGAAQGQVGGP